MKHESQGVMLREARKIAALIAFGTAGGLAIGEFLVGGKPKVIPNSRIEQQSAHESAPVKQKADLNNCTISGNIEEQVKISCPGAKEVIIGTFHKTGQEAVK